MIRIKKPTILLDLRKSGYECLNHRNYVVLRQLDGAPARVYRLRKNGRLSRVADWPLPLSVPPPASDQRGYYYRLEKNPLKG